MLTTQSLLAAHHGCWQAHIACSVKDQCYRHLDVPAAAAAAAAGAMSEHINTHMMRCSKIPIQVMPLGAVSAIGCHAVHKRKHVTTIDVSLLSLPLT
jgi:hypothetical protein